MASKAKVWTGAAAGGAALIALGVLPFLEGTGPSAGPGHWKSYVDIAGVVTICRGHTGPDVKIGMVVPESVCRDLDEKDIGIAFAAEDKYLIHPEELAPHVRAAGALFILNVGTEAFRTSTFRRMLNARRIPAACDALMLFIKARVGGGPKKAVVGLINRRTFERKMCLGEKLT
jgi:lysozyme